MGHNASQFPTPEACIPDEDLANYAGPRFESELLNLTEGTGQPADASIQFYRQTFGRGWSGGVFLPKLFQDSSVSLGFTSSSAVFNSPFAAQKINGAGPLPLETLSAIGVASCPIYIPPLARRSPSVLFPIAANLDAPSEADWSHQLALATAGRRILTTRNYVEKAPKDRNGHYLPPPAGAPALSIDVVTVPLQPHEPRATLFAALLQITRSTSGAPVENQGFEAALRPILARRDARLVTIVMLPEPAFVSGQNTKVHTFLGLFEKVENDAAQIPWDFKIVETNENVGGASSLMKRSHSEMSIINIMGMRGWQLNAMIKNEFVHLGGFAETGVVVNNTLVFQRRHIVAETSTEHMDAVPESWKVTVLRSRVINVGRPDELTVYDFQVVSNMSAWAQLSGKIVSKRYNSFADFYTRLRQHHPQWILPEMPPKDITARWNGSVASVRQKAFQHIFDAIARSAGLTNSPIVIDFFQQ